MQDIHQILSGGSGGPIFADRRLRSVQQAIKCPRCDSSSTKFCYYNNYNLSQPRHFCKNCRRYWTNGGVLRNVPIGGGCRKTKRSSKRKAASPSPARSSSECTSAKAKKQATATGSGSESFSSPVFNFSEQNPLNYTAQEPTRPEISVASANPTVFAEIGGFTSFVSGNQSQSQSLFGFGGGGGITPSPFRIHHQNQVNHNQDENQELMRSPVVESWQMEKLDGGDRYGVLDQTVQTDLVPGGERSHIGNLFDLTAGNWSQSADQWHESDRDHDHHLYLPP